MVASDQQQDESARARRPLVALLVVGLVAALVLLVGLAVVRGSGRNRTSPGVPAFPSLQAHPDPSLHGTVAYVAADDCVHVVAASGAGDRSVLCTGPPVADPARGKEIGPQLVWRVDGRLEVTMFTMADQPKAGPTFEPGWQKVVDVRTGAVEDVPTAQVPTRADRSTHPSTDASGVQLRFSTTQRAGFPLLAAERSEVRIWLVAPGGAQHTLLRAEGPGSYTYAMYAAFWAPDGTWVAADDNRVLVVTTGPRPRTRVLVPVQGGTLDPNLARFAVTSADLVTGAS